MPNRHSKKTKTTGKPRRVEIAEKFKSASRSVIEESGNKASREHLKSYLDAQYGLYRMDDTLGRWRAFNAISLIAANELHAIENGSNEIPLESEISVPWWAIEAVFAGWNDFVGSAADSLDRKTLGRSFGVERDSTGVPSNYERSHTKDRDRSLALLIAHERRRDRNGLDPATVESAIQFISSEELSERTLWSAWTDYGEAAEKFFED